MNTVSLLILGASLVVFGASCQGETARVQQAHSSILAISPDGTRLFVGHPDADSVTIMDTVRRKIVHEIRLAETTPFQDPITQRYIVAVSPRALALDSTGDTLFVTGQRSGLLYQVNPARGTVTTSVAVCAEPIGVLVSSDNTRVFVACAQDDQIVAVDRASMTVVGRVATPRKPWALAWAEDRQTLLVSHFLGAGISTVATHPLALQNTWPIVSGTPGPDPTVPHGQVRGLYDLALRPGTDEVWVTHLMLGTDTPQPSLNFQNTVFPALSQYGPNGQALARLSISAHPGEGAFEDVVSGPHALTFSPDGHYALIANANSEDILMVDAVQQVEALLVRPLPGHMPEGIVWSIDGKIYLYERNTEDIAVFEMQTSAHGPVLLPVGDPMPALSQDPMPAQLRLGQKMFYSANSDDIAVTSNHWVACASCHLEGRSDGVTWDFAQGPRDTPSNAGGTLDTGFLFRTADRNQVQDYWKTINVEQGGHFSLTSTTQRPLLDALADFVNYAIPIPVPPTTDADLRAQGEQIFNRVGCGSCHSGPARTDSGAGNPDLNMSGPVRLHDVGTCVTQSWPDVAHEDKANNLRAACAFDTPALRGLWDSAPYLHDGSAATLLDVVAGPMGRVGGSTVSAGDQQALAEYLKSL